MRGEAWHKAQPPPWAPSQHRRYPLKRSSPAGDAALHPRFSETVRATLRLQWLHIALSSLWNGAGLWRVANGEAPLGPSASWLVLLLALGAGAVMTWGVQKNHRGYAIASAAMALALLAPIVGALVLDTTRWPSPWWRWGGLMLNGVGLAANLRGLQHWYRHCHPRPNVPLG